MATPIQPGILDGLRKALAGPQPLHARDGLFGTTAPARALAQSAIDAGYLQVESQTLPAVGRARARTAEVGMLTDSGRELLLAQDDPKPLLQAILDQLKSRSPQAASSEVPASFQTALDKATDKCVAAIDKAIGDLRKVITTETAKLKPAPASTQSDLSNTLPILEKMFARIAQTAQSTATPTAPAQSPASSPVQATPVKSPPPTAAGTAPIDSASLRSQIKDSYDELCLYAEFRDRLVEIPRLYRELLRRVPNVSLADFHQAISQMSTERVLELHVLNEVRTAKHPELAITKNDRLYYYVIWN